MFESFIPPSAQRLNDSQAIALLHRLHRHSIKVPGLMSSDIPITVQTAAITPENLGTQSDYSPILLLHGFDSSLLEFRYLLPYLEPHRSVFAVDVLGFGFTAHHPSISIEPRTIRQHLFCTWKSLIDRPVTLVGASLGGAIAIDFALTHPDSVEKLILINSIGFSGNVPIGKLLASPILDLGADWLHIRKNAALYLLEVLPFVSSEQQDLVLCSALHQAMPYWKHAVKSFTRSGGYGYLRQQFSEINLPTLILWGEKDETLGTQDARKFQRAIRDSHLVWVKGADHVPHIHTPQAVARELVLNTAKSDHHR